MQGGRERRPGSTARRPHCGRANERGVFLRMCPGTPPPVEWALTASTALCSVQHLQESGSAEEGPRCSESYRDRLPVSPVCSRTVFDFTCISIVSRLLVAATSLPSSRGLQLDLPPRPLATAGTTLAVSHDGRHNAAHLPLLGPLLRPPFTDSIQLLSIV